MLPSLLVQTLRAKSDTSDERIANDNERATHSHRITIPTFFGTLIKPENAFIPFKYSQNTRLKIVEGGIHVCSYIMAKDVFISLTKYRVTGKCRFEGGLFKFMSLRFCRLSVFPPIRMACDKRELGVFKFMFSVSLFLSLFLYLLFLFFLYREKQ